MIGPLLGLTWPEQTLIASIQSDFAGFVRQYRDSRSDHDVNRDDNDWRQLLSWAHLVRYFLFYYLKKTLCFAHT